MGILFNQGLKPAKVLENVTAGASLLAATMKEILQANGKMDPRIWDADERFREVSEPPFYQKVRFGGYSAHFQVSARISYRNPADLCDFLHLRKDQEERQYVAYHPQASFAQCSRLETETVTEIGRALKWSEGLNIQNFGNIHLNVQSQNELVLFNLKAFAYKGMNFAPWSITTNIRSNNQDAKGAHVAYAGSEVYLRPDLVSRMGRDLHPLHRNTVPSQEELAILKSVFEPSQFRQLLTDLKKAALPEIKAFDAAQVDFAKESIGRFYERSGN